MKTIHDALSHGLQALEALEPAEAAARLKQARTYVVQGDWQTERRTGSFNPQLDAQRMMQLIIADMVLSLARRNASFRECANNIQLTTRGLRD